MFSRSIPARLLRLVPLLCACICVPHARAQFFENFESVQPGPVCGQRGWEEWAGDQDVCGNVNFGPAFSGQRALRIVGSVGGQTGQGDDTVHRFPHASGGQWTFRIMTLVPAAAVGKAYIVLLSTYDDPPGSPIDDYRWSMQVGFDADTGLVTADFNLGQAPLVRGRWAEFRAEIDLDSDRVDYYYDGVRFVTNHSWINGVSIGGRPVIQALDLYAGEPGMGGTSGMYFDDVRLHRPVPARLTAPCRCDWNGVGGLNSQDFFDFLNAFFSGAADFNGDHATNSQDFFDFLTCFFGGCPQPHLVIGARTRAGRHEVYIALDHVGSIEDFMSVEYDPATGIEDPSTQRLFGLSLDELAAMDGMGGWMFMIRPEVQDGGDLSNDCDYMRSIFDGTEAELQIAKRQSKDLRGMRDHSGASDPGWDVNGCTDVPDFDFAYCCDAHDVCYCQGGNEDARVACDEALRDCIANSGHPYLAELYYLGVRAFGSHFFSYH